MKKILALVLAVLMALSLVSALAEKADADYTGSITIYSPHDADPLNAGVTAFEAKYPNVKVEVVADGTGNLLNRIAAESAAPMADVLWGGGADSLAAYKQYFQAYIPSCMDLIDPSLADAEGYWIGESPLPMVFLVNTDLVPAEEIPQTWKDLADPKWEGKIAFANPASSGFIYMMIHEQYFYSDYARYLPDYRERVFSAVEWCVEHGYHPAFMRDTLLGR